MTIGTNSKEVFESLRYYQLLFLIKGRENVRSHIFPTPIVYKGRGNARPHIFLTPIFIPLA